MRYRNISKLVRASCGVSGKSYPIEIIDGFDEPCLVGKRHHYVNKSGDLISFPSAYRKAWGKPIYVNSTLKVVVGAGWIIENSVKRG